MQRDENGVWQEVSREALSSYASSGTNSGLYASYNPIDFSQYIDAEAFDITAYDSSVMETCKPLAGIGAAAGISYLTDPTLQSSLHNQNIVSDLQYVSQSMNEIRSSIQNTKFLSSLQGLTFRNSEGIPGCLTPIIEAYFQAVGALLATLANETNSIMSYAQACADMDSDYANKAGKISEIDANGNMTSIDPMSYTRPTYNALNPTTIPAVAAGAAAGAAGAAGAGGTSGGTSGSPSAGSNKNDNLIVEPTRNPDGTYTVRKTNPADNTVVEELYDENGNFISRKTYDANGNLVSPEGTETPTPQQTEEPSESQGEKAEIIFEEEKPQ